MITKKSKIIAEALGDFSFTFKVEKAEIDESNSDEMTIVGIASTINVDHDDERMAEPALDRMANIINEKSVPLRVEHQKNDDAIIGKVDEAWLDDRKNLWVKAKLNKENSAAVMLHNALKAGAKLGLSVGGRVKRATRELVEGAGKMIKTFYDVILDEVSVTPRPANYDAWLIKKHYVEENDDIDTFSKSSLGKMLYDTFLFENPKFDYLMAIEKSIPDQAWKKVEPETINKDMFGNIKKVKDETEETESPKETNSDKKEEIASKSYVDKKFSELSDLIKSALAKVTEIEATGTTRETTTSTEETIPAVEQKLPTDEKTENPAQERTVKEGANGTTDTSREATSSTTTTTTETPALDSSNPTTPKEENPAQVKSISKRLLEKLSDKIRKATESAISELSDSLSDEKKKEASSEDDTEVDTSEKTDDKDTTSESTSDESEATKSDEESSGSSDSKTLGEEYELPELKRSSKPASIDVYASYVAKTIDDAEERLSKGGKRVPGLRSMILDVIRNDEEIQKSVSQMMKEPGAKRSVSFGIPYAVSKDGSRLRLVADDTVVQKTINPKAKFGDVYKAYFSSANDNKK